MSGGLYGWRVIGLVAALVFGATSQAAAAEGDQPPTTGPFQWVSIGPTFIEPTNQSYDLSGSSGRVSTIDVSSAGVLAATANGGIWKRNSNSWSALTDGQRDLAFGAVATAPSNPRVIYAGTGEDHGFCTDCGPGEDLYKSTDGGATWQTLPALPGLGVGGMTTSAIAVDKSNPNDVWVGGSLGVYRSQDGGQSWSVIQGADPNYPAPIVDLKLDPTRSGVAYFTDRRRVRKYDASRTQALTDITAPIIASDESTYPALHYAIALALAPSLPNVLYASYAYSGNYENGCLAGLFKSQDGGSTWVSIDLQSGNDYLSSAYAYGGNSTLCQGWYDNVLAVDPLDSNHLLAGGVAIAEFDTSDPANPTQRNLANISHVHPDHHALAFDSSGNLYDGNDGGVWYFPHSALGPRGSGAGQNYSRGLAITTFSGGVSLFTNGNGGIFAGSQDNGSELYSHAAGGWTWKRLALGDGGYTDVDQNDNDILYHEFFEGFMRRSTDGGATWTTISPSFGGQPRSWVMPFKSDPSASATLLAGASQLFETTTGGVASGGTSAWAAVNPTGLSKITSIDMSAGKQQIVVGDSAGRVAYSFDAGATWRTASVPGVVTVVKFDPYSKSTFYVASRDRQQPFVPHLVRMVRASDEPAQDRKIEAGLVAPVESILFLPSAFVAGTDRGVFIRSRFGGPWVRQASVSGAPSIPAVPVMDIALRDDKPWSSGSLVALSHGRGAWVSNSVAGIGPHVYTASSGRNGSVFAYVLGTSQQVWNLNNVAGASQLQLVAFDAQGQLYATGLNSARLNVFAAGASGGAERKRAITGDQTQLVWPRQIAVGPDGKAYVGDGGDQGWIEVFGPAVDGNMAPTQLIRGPNTGLRVIRGLTVAGGKLYVTSCTCDYNAATNRIAVYPASASGDVAPERTLEGDRLGLLLPGPIAVDAAGKIYVGDRGSINIYAAGASGNAAPLATIAGPATGLDENQAQVIAIDDDGDILVGGFRGGLSIFDASANGNVAPRSVFGTQYAFVAVR